MVLAACGGGEDEPDVFRAPLYVESGPSLSWVLDATRAKFFAWDGERRIVRTLRAQGVDDRLGVPVIVGARNQDLLFGGFALDASETSLAVGYSLGVGEREGRLAIFDVGALPVDDEPATFSLSPSARGPFAVPATEGRFLLVTPTSGGEADWATYPDEATQTGPAARRLAWNAAADRVYAASEVTAAVHVREWPGLAPVTDIAVGGVPLDVDVSPDDGSLAVVTSDALAVYSADGELEAEHELEGLPWRVLFSRRFEGQVVAVLNQNGTLLFFDREEGLCGIDRDSVGFQVVDLRYQDSGPASNNRLVDVEPVGCRSQIPADGWAITYEGVVTSGTAVVAAGNALEGEGWNEAGVEPGDRLLLDGFTAEVTGVTSDRLFFSPATDATPSSQISFGVRTVGTWVVAGTETGVIGRAETGARFEGPYLTFTIAEGSASPDTGDRFLFTSDPGVTPVTWSSPPFDMAENAQGHWLVPAFRSGLVSGVDLRRNGNAWVIETIYTLR